MKFRNLIRPFTSAFTGPYLNSLPPDLQTNPLPDANLDESATRTLQKTAQKMPANDRRKHTRFQVKDGAFIVIRSGKANLAQIIDISQGGISVRYVDSHQRPFDPFELDLFFPHIGIYLRKPSVETVSDLEIHGERYTNPITNKPLTVRRRSLKFSDLSFSEQVCLKDFIQRHTAQAI